MEDVSLRRAHILIEQNRWPDAERELRAALASDPQSAGGHALLSLVLQEQAKLNDATQLAERAIVLDPEDSLGFYALASVLEKRNRYADALKPLDEAIRIDPFDPKLHALVAQIRLQQRNYTEALAAADRGLEIDPAHDACVNLRGIALVHLGRREEASRTIDGALERDPENTVTHANQGWALLHRNQPKPAMEHFREALRLDPNNDWAKAGIVEAMKARNPLYRGLLAYFLFMSRLGDGAQWAIVIGLWLMPRIVSGLTKDDPSLAWLGTTLRYVYFVFAISTWLAPALADLVLRLDRFGRYCLSREQIWTSNLIGALALCTAAAFGVWAAFGTPALELAAFGLLLLMLPASRVFHVAAGWPRWVVTGFLILLAALGSLAVFVAWVRPEETIAARFFGPFILVAIVSQLVILGIGNAKPKA